MEIKRRVRQGQQRSYVEPTVEPLEFRGLSIMIELSLQGELDEFEDGGEL